VINHCDRHITHLGDLDISFILLDISSKFLLHISCFTGVHLGREKLLYIISQKYYWQGICHKVREFLRGCKECQDKVESQQMKKHYMEIVTNPEDYIGVETKVEETLDMNVEDESDLASVSFSDSWITMTE
jgi:hypothetical protein